MNSLDRAFIRAYARDLDVDSLAAAAASRSAAAAPPRRRAKPARPSTAAAEPVVQVSYADGGWYRIEEHEPAAAVAPAPHARYENSPPPQAAPREEPSAGDDIDLMARFRPPMFRAVTFRTHAQAVAAKAEAIAAGAEALSVGSGTAEPPSSPFESFDYTLAPPSPPLIPRTSVTEYTPHESPPAADAPAMPALARLAPQAIAEAAARPTQLTEAEIQQYASDCVYLQSVVLEPSGDETLASPDEAHVMLVDMPLNLLDDNQQREHKRQQEEELARQRQAMLAELMLQEVIRNEAVCEPQWIYGSEAHVNFESAPHAELVEAAAEPSHACPPPAEEEPLARQAAEIAPQLAEAATGSEPFFSAAPAVECACASEVYGGEATMPAAESEAPAAESEAPTTLCEAPATLCEAPAEPREEPSVEPTFPAPSQSAVEPLPREPIAPAWEVDRIAWPPISDQLLDDVGDQFQAAIDRFQSTSAGRAVVVTGHQRGEGRTTLAICLARAASAAGLRVALVDADFDSPQIARNLSLDTIGGWDGVLQGGVDLNEAAIASLDDQMTVVPLEKALSPAAIGTNHDRLEAALDRLAASFDLVLLDAAPSTELLAEGSWLRKLAVKPHLLLAHDMRSASLLEVQQTIELAQVAGFEVVGIAQTFAPDQE